MYLGVRLLDGRKALRRKDKLPKVVRDEGPDLCIQKGRRRIWVEVIAPSPGDDTNLDKVPDLFASGAERDNRRKIELRIAGALKTKADKFASYREKGIVGPKDSCIVAIAASQFALEAEAESGAGLPLPVTTVYPFGEEVITIDPTEQNQHRLQTADHVQKKGLTQEQFAEISGFSQQYISGLEQGRRNPTVVTVYELATALGVNYLDLLQPD